MEKTMRENFFAVNREHLDALKELIKSNRASEEQWLEYAQLVSRSKLFNRNADESDRQELDCVLRQGAERYPDSPRVRAELARTVGPFGQTDANLMKQAIALYESQGEFESADYAANDMATEIAHAGAQFLDEDDAEAARRFEEAIRIFPWNATAHLNLGLVHESTGNWKASARCYWRAVQLGRIACHARESWNRRMGRMVKSAASGKTHYWGETETRPFLEALYNLATLYYRARKFSLARRYTEESLDFNPSDNTGARFILYSILRFEGKKDEMQRLARRYGSAGLRDQADHLESSTFGTSLEDRSGKTG